MELSPATAKLSFYPGLAGISRNGWACGRVPVESAIAQQSSHRTGHEGYLYPVPRCHTFPYGKGYQPCFYSTLPFIGRRRDETIHRLQLRLILMVARSEMQRVPRAFRPGENLQHGLNDSTS